MKFFRKNNNSEVYIIYPDKILKVHGWMSKKLIKQIGEIGLEMALTSGMFNTQPDIKKISEWMDINEFELDNEKIEEV